MILDWIARLAFASSQAHGFDQLAGLSIGHVLTGDTARSDGTLQVLFGLANPTANPNPNPFGCTLQVLFGLAAVFMVGQNLGYAQVPAPPGNTMLMFGASAISVVSGMQPPILRAMFSKQFDPDELGVVRAPNPLPF
jgi:hypothetical protein